MDTIHPYYPGVNNISFLRGSNHCIAATVGDILDAYCGDETLAVTTVAGMLVRLRPVAGKRR